MNKLISNSKDLLIYFLSKVVIIAISLLTLFNVNVVNAQTSSSFTFTAAGDYGNSTTSGGTAFNTFTNVKNINPSFHLALGDLAYTTAEQSWCTNLKALYNNLLIVSGNHDSGESSAGNINTYAQYCPYTLTSTLTGTYGKQYYFDYPATNPIARIIMIVPGIGGSFIGLDTSYTIGHQGYTFTSNAIDDARTKGIKWVVVGMHKNFISTLEKSNELGPDLIPMLINKKVDLILQGHEHGYERTKQIGANGATCTVQTGATTDFKAGTYNSNCVVDSDNSFVKGAGSIIDVLGTGGQGFRALSTSDSEYPYFAVANNSTSNFGVGKFTLTDTQLSYTYVKNSSSGNLTDSFTITANGSIPPSPTPTASPTPSPTSSPTPLPTPTNNPTASPTASPTPAPTGCQNVPTTLGAVTDSVNIPTAGSYTVWSRLMASSDSSNAYYLQIDSNCPVVVGDLIGMAANSWTWVDYKDGNTGTKLRLTLTTGAHTVKMIGKDLGTKLDKIIFVSDQTCVPSGNGDNCLGSSLPTPTATSTSSPTASPTASPTFSPTPSPTPLKQGDLDGNGKVDIFDYNIILTNYGKTGSGIQGDIDGNGKVDIFDYNILLTNFGK